MNAALTTGGTMDATSVAPAVLLADHLKALKLPTFAREYDKVAAIAAQDRAGTGERTPLRERCDNEDPTSKPPVSWGTP